MRLTVFPICLGKNPKIRRDDFHIVLYLRRHRTRRTSDLFRFNNFSISQLQISFTGVGVKISNGKPHVKTDTIFRLAEKQTRRRASQRCRDTRKNWTGRWHFYFGQKESRARDTRVPAFIRLARDLSLWARTYNALGRTKASRERNERLGRRVVRDPGNLSPVSRFGVCRSRVMLATRIFFFPAFAPERKREKKHPFRRRLTLTPFLVVPGQGGTS